MRYKRSIPGLSVGDASVMLTKGAKVDWGALFTTRRGGVTIRLSGRAVLRLCG
jgi:hypothetical protein